MKRAVRFASLVAAGSALADRLVEVGGATPDLVLTPARRGVPVAVEVGRRLGAPVDLVVVGDVTTEDALLRQGRPAVDPTGLRLLLVDDGIGSGATMRGAVEWALSAGAVRVDVAVPVAPSEQVYELRARLGRRGGVIALQQPLLARSVHWAYDDFTAPTDEQVLAWLLRPESDPGAE